MPKTLNATVRQFYDETLPVLGNTARQWFEAFYDRLERCPFFDELERKTSRAFVRCVLQATWQFFLESRIMELLTEPLDNYSRHRAERFALVQRVREALDSSATPARKRKRRVGRPRPALDNVSSPSRLAWDLTERARAETRKPHWELFAHILNRLFPDEFPDKTGYADLTENLRRRVNEFQKRHDIDSKTTTTATHNTSNNRHRLSTAITTLNNDSNLDRK